MNTDLSNFTDEQFQEEMLRRSNAKQLADQKQKETYQELKAETVHKLCIEALQLHDDLKQFKALAFDSMQTLYAILQEYSARHADGKGNFRVDFKDFRISYKRQGKGTFDERADQAEKHIIDFVTAHFENDKDTQDLVMSLLERKKGDLDVNLIQKLYAMEDRFQNENWKKGIALLKESYSYCHSKDYMAFEKRDEAGEWKAINLQFSRI